MPRIFRSIRPSRRPMPGRRGAATAGVAAAAATAEAPATAEALAMTETPAVAGTSGLGASTAAVPEPAGELRLPVGISIAEAERRLILATLAHCDGHRERAAEILGISAKTLYNRMKKYQSAPEGGTEDRAGQGRG